MSTKTDSVRSRVFGAILRGDYGPGDRIPAEREMAQTTATSRVTVRRAYAQLEPAGVLERRQGSGARIIQSTVGVGEINVKLADQAGKVVTRRAGQQYGSQVVGINPQIILQNALPVQEGQIKAHIVADDGRVSDEGANRRDDVRHRWFADHILRLNEDSQAGILQGFLEIHADGNLAPTEGLAKNDGPGGSDAGVADATAAAQHARVRLLQSCAAAPHGSAGHGDGPQDVEVVVAGQE